EIAKTAPNLTPEEMAAAGQPSRVQQAQEQLAELRLRYTDQHPDIIALKQLIGVLKSEGAAAGGAARVRSRPVPNPGYEQMRIQLIDTESLVASLQRQVQQATRDRDRLEAMARAAPGVQADSENLDRDYNVLRRNYEELLA